MMTLEYPTTLLSTKNTWPLVRLEELCIIDPSKRELGGMNSEMEVSYGMMADLGEHYQRFQPTEIKVLSEVQKTGLSYFRDNDVLLAKMTPCFENGKSGVATELCNGIGFGSTEFYVLRSNGKILPSILYHIISSKAFLEEGRHHLVGTTGRRRLLKHFVANYQIPLPSIEEQWQIADLFGNIEDGITEVSAQENRLGQLQKILSNGLAAVAPSFGSVVKAERCTTCTFGDIATGIEQHDKQPLANGLSRFIGLENIASENFALQGSGEIEKGTTFTKRFTRGDVLFGKRRAYLKKVAVADFDGVCSGDILVLRANAKKILPELLPYYAASDPFIAHAVSTSAGSLSPRTKWRDLADFQLSIPTLDIQRQIAVVFKALQDSIDAVTNQKNVLKQLKSALLNEILG